MVEPTKELDLLKVCIDDEHHYRTMVQSRVSYHSSIVLALIALSSALAVRAVNTFDYFIVALIGLLVCFASRQAGRSIERLYEHFIEAIRAREEIEILLGIREPEQKRKTAHDPARTLQIDPNKNEKYWHYDALLHGSWIPPSDTGGFFKRTQGTFTIFFIVGCFIVGFMILWGLIAL